MKKNEDPQESTRKRKRPESKIHAETENMVKDPRFAGLPYQEKKVAKVRGTIKSRKSKYTGWKEYKHRMCNF